MTDTILTIDGSEGEGGGQILRTALTLAMVTGTPFRMARIRENRNPGGLRPQHLAAVRAAAEISAAMVSGDAVNSRDLEFHPQAVRAGDWRFDVGTAGSATLVLQTVLPALAMADGPSTVVVEGGTHNPMAPPFEFLERAWAPLFRRMGVGLKLKLDRVGFYPAGGGKIRASIEPCAKLAPIELLERGATDRVRAEAVVLGLSPAIAERELAVAKKRLGLKVRDLIPVIATGVGLGNAFLLTVDSANVSEVFSAVGAKGHRAEEVAAQAVVALEVYLASKWAVGPYLADQLLVLLSIAKGGAFTTGALTLHTVTNIATIRKFLPVSIVQRESEDMVTITVACLENGPA